MDQCSRLGVAFSAGLLIELFRQADVGFALLDHQLRYITLNPFLANIHGSSPESDTGKQLHEVVGGLASQLVPAFTEVVATGRPILDLEVKGAVSADTKAGHWIDNVFPLKDERGRVKIVCAVVTEAPSHKQVDNGQHDLASLTSRTVLRSWKEIAAYTGACVKTVQRWERSYALPVRRLRASKGSVVSALKFEVDGWMREQMPATKADAKDDLFRPFFTSSPIPALIVSDEQVVIDANFAMAALLTIERNDLLGKPLRTICEPNQEGRRWQRNAVVTGSWKIHRTDGTVFTADCVSQSFARGMRSISLINIGRDTLVTTPHYSMR